jgi:succinate dehydrogenase/fumarate reductase flavoprotein subunit
MKETIKTIKVSLEPSVGDAANSWCGPEPEIRDSDIAETVYTDILICGAGSGGMVAAIVAGKQGVKTLVIEKNRKVGYFKTYVGAVDTRAQKAVGDKAKIDKDEIVQELLRYPTQYSVEEKYIKNRNPVDEKLIRLWANESGQAVDFLADELAEYGITLVAEYDVGEGHHGKFKAYPVHTKFIVPFLKSGPKSYIHGGIGAVEPWMVRKAKSYGVEFSFNTSLVKLVKQDSKVTGAIARRKNGNYIKINVSKGVLLCSGGYASDSELFAKLNPQAASVTTYSYTQPGNVGDGIKAGIWAGGEKDRYPSAMLFDRGITKPGGRSGLPFKKSGSFMGGFNAFHFGSQPFLKVNMDGKRFYCESVPYDAILYPLEFDKNGVCCVIWDANFWQNVKRFHTIACSRQIPSKSRPRTYEGIGCLANTVLLTWARLRGCIQKADTIEELAIKLKLPVDVFKATVERYNQMAKAGVDEDFGKPAKDLIPLETPPFYGATNAGWVLTTMDGLHINSDMQVLDKNGNVIEGLYAAGDVAGGFFACNYYPELVPGVASGKTVTFTRHAILHMTGAIQKAG